MSSCHCRLQARVLATVAWLTVIPASAATLTWNVNVAGDWAIGTNWTPAGPPAAVDIAVVNSGNPQLNAPATVLGYDQGGGTLSGTGNLTVTGSSTWTTGTQTGAAVTQYDGPLAISGPGVKTISGSRTVTLNGNATWSGNTGANNTIALSTGTINNNATFTDQNTFNNALTGSGVNAFNNTGTWTKDATSTGTTTVTATFNNTGTLNVNAGSMNMTASTHSGTINIAAGASVEFRNGTNTLNDATTTGAGTLIISTDNVGADGIAAINGGTLNSAFLLSGGSLRGTSHVFNGSASWTGGTITGLATESTSFAGTLAISGPTAKSLTGGRTVNAGNTTWSGNTGNNNNAIGISTASVFNSNGTFTDANTFDSAINAGGGGGTFNNNGTFNKESATTTAIGVVFNNSGTVNVNAGTFLPGGGGTSSGVFNIADGAKLEYRNGNHTLNNVTISGSGLLQISTENVGADAFVSVNGGTLTSGLLLSGSTLGGTDHAFQGPVSWTGGTIAGDGVGDFETTTFSNDVAITGVNTKTIRSGRTVNLQATTTWSGNTAANNNAISFVNGATVNNNGTFNDDNTFQAFIEHSVGAPHNFNNIGTYNKNGNSLTIVDGGVAFNNSGTVNINAGILRPSGGTSTGTFNIAAGATLQFQDGANVLDNVTTAGAGTFAIITDNVGGDTTVSVNGGTHTTAFLLAGSTLAGTDHVFQGQATWTGGAISGAASTTFTNDVTISGPNLKTIVGGRTVNLEATTTWTGNTAVNNNAIRFWNGATLNNNGTFNDENTFQAFIEHNVGGPHVFNNVGTYNKNGNSVTLFDLGVTLNNTGNFNVNAGSIQHAGAFDNAGTITTAAGTTFATTGLSIDLQNHGVLQGTGTYDPANARAVINAGEVRPGTATTVGDLTIAGNYTQTAVGLFQVNLASLSMFDTMDVVLGNLALDGVLQVTSLDGYNPVLGDTFTIITFDDGVADASDLAGAFNSIVPVGFDPALIFDVLYFDHEVVLTVAAVPLPPAWPLAGTALAAALLRARRRVTRNPSR